jgi:CxxC-x17-CxxC domain-containing protein
MGNFTRDNKFSGGGARGGFGGGSRGGFGGGARGGFGADRGPREMHKATCDACNQECEVPFRPTGERPVFCRDCFGKQDGGNDRSSDRGPSRFNSDPHGTRVSFGDKPMYKADCAKCGNTCEVPFRPSGDRPVYCRECFGKEGGKGGNNEELKAAFAAVNAKLDRVLLLLAPASAKPTAEAKKAAKVEDITSMEAAPAVEAKPKKDTKAKKEPTVKKAAKAAKKK